MRPERKDISKMRKFDNLEGRQFGEITILYPIETPEHVGKTNKSQYYWAQCSCGKEYAVSARTLKRKKRSNPNEKGATACIDCAHKLRIAKFRTSHGLSQTRLYRLWLSMKGRCSEKWATNSHGARGIEVCEKWNKEGEEGFLQFHEWSMANGYAEGLTLERLDVNGLYSPDNCAWVGAKEQNYNKRNSLKIEVNGEMVSLSQYYYSEPNRIVPYSVISNRHRAGWTLEEMFSIPYGGKRGGGSILKKEAPAKPQVKPEPIEISPRRKDWTGAKLGKLEILYPIAVPEHAKRANPDQFFWARCECGKEYSISHHTIMKGAKACKSCTGKEVGKMYHKPNREARKRLNKIWEGMRRRCAPDGHLGYGQRGIRVCDSWNQDFPSGFESFFSWALENGYKNTLSLERLDVDGPYSPENCCWISAHAQGFNKRNTIYVEYKGKHVSLAKLYHDLGSNIPYTAVYSRYNRGWSAEKIFSEPYHPRNKG